LPWNYFANAFSKAGISLVGSAHLISKVYFPRLVIPISGVLAGLVDFLIVFCVLLGLMLFYGIVPTLAILALPLFVLLAVATALAFRLLLFVLYVLYLVVVYC